MGKLADRLNSLVKVGQGLQWLWTIGGSLVVAALAAGVAAVAALPWWSVAVAGVGAFMVALAVALSIAQSLGRPSPLSPIIERGYSLRERLVADHHDGSDPAYVAAWETRVADWIEDARVAIRSVAPNREGAFIVDVIVADSPGTADMPYWKSSLLLELDMRIERVILVRASL